MAQRPIWDAFSPVQGTRSSWELSSERWLSVSSRSPGSGCVVEQGFQDVGAFGMWTGFGIVKLFLGLSVAQYADGNLEGNRIIF